MIHPDTKAMLEYLLVMLSVKGEEYTYSYIKKEVLKGHIPYEKDKINQLEQGLHVCWNIRYEVHFLSCDRVRENKTP